MKESRSIEIDFIIETTGKSEHGKTETKIHCGARQTPVWTSPRAAALAVPVTEPLAAVLTAAGKWQISDIHITDLLDIRTESHYNAT